MSRGRAQREGGSERVESSRPPQKGPFTSTVVAKKGVRKEDRHGRRRGRTDRDQPGGRTESVSRPYLLLVSVSAHAEAEAVLCGSPRGSFLPIHPHLDRVLAGKLAEEYGMIQLLYLATEGLGSSHFYCLFLRRRWSRPWIGVAHRGKKNIFVFTAGSGREWLRWPNTQKGTFRVFRGDTDRLVAVWMGRRRR